MANTALEYALSEAKQSFEAAKKQYFQQKEKAQESYEGEKEQGMTNLPFKEWAPIYAPALTTTLTELEAASTNVQRVAKQIWGNDIWSHLDKDEYLLIHDNIPGRVHMQGLKV